MTREELLQVKDAIIAVDFDMTLALTETYFDVNGTFIGVRIIEPIYEIIELCLELQKNNKMILWTARSGESEKEAAEWCKNYGLRWDAVNDNVDEVMKRLNARKVFAHHYIDDRAISLRELFKCHS